MVHDTQERFTKRSRLTKSHEFRVVQRHGRRANAAHLVVWSHVNPPAPSNAPQPNAADECASARLGLAVSRKVGKAHDRNLLRRRVREIFRRRLVVFACGHDYVVVARPGAAELSFDGLREELQLAVPAATKQAAQQAAKRQRQANDAKASAP